MGFLRQVTYLDQDLLPEVDTRHIYLTSNPPGADVSFETDELWIILPDVRSITTPAHVNITVDPNMTPGWRTGYVRFVSHGFDGAVLEISQMGESVLINNRIFPTNHHRQAATRKSDRAWETDTIRATIRQPVGSGNFADQHGCVAAFFAGPAGLNPPGGPPAIYCLRFCAAVCEYTPP